MLTLYRNISVLILVCFAAMANTQNFSLIESKAFTGYTDYIRQGKFSPYGNYIALTVGDNSVEVYDKDYKKLWSSKGDYTSVGGQISFSPDEKYLAFSKYKTKADVGILRLSDMQVIQNLSEHADYVNAVSFSPDGKYLATSSDDYSVNVWKWDGAKFSEFHTLTTHTTQANCVAFSPDGQTLVSAFEDGIIKVWQCKNDNFMEIQNIPGNKYSIQSLAFHPSGKYFVSGGSDFAVKIYQKEGAQFKEIKKLEEPYGTIYGISFTPDGNYIAATRSNSTVKIWKIEGNVFKDEKVINRHGANVFDVDFSLDGKYMLTSSSDKSALVWSLEGVKPCPKALIQESLGMNLTSAQRKIMTGATPEKILAKVDNSLTSPKDEFETNQDYQKRKDKLQAHLLLLLQQQTEVSFGVTSAVDGKNNKVSMKLEKLGSYNSDNQVYTIYFMETSAKVTIPIVEAKSFKEAWQKGKITALKSLHRDGISYTYTDYKLVHPVTGTPYILFPEENPFNPGTGFQSSAITPSYKSNDIEDPAKYDKSSIPGVHYALIFATNDYDNYDDLVNPVNDSRAIAEELKKNYGFQVDLKENPTLDQIVATLRIYAQKEYNPKDQLMIFFAGHGKYDDIFKEGYLVAKGSKLDDETKTSLLSHSNLRTIVNNIPCEHIFLTMDVCFGGTFDPLIASRGADEYSNITKTDFIERKMAHKTRIYLTSGGKEYVPDGRPGEHSPFARKLLEALRSYGGEDGILTTNEIFTKVEKVVPQPRIGEFGHNEPGSDFIFIAK
jgi:WD40 repeat protein